MYTELGCIFIGFILGVAYDLFISEIFYFRKKKK